MTGRFITLEGGEGTGKSTQIRRLAATLGEKGIATLCTREPGGSPGAEEIRKLLVEGEPGRWDAVTETLLVYAARADHVARHRLADLFLDNLPFNAHSTASDALWAGLPVLTCRGNAFAGRVCAGLLEAAGLPELITHNLEDYEALAVDLACQPGRLADVRARVEQETPKSPLFDTAGYTRKLEAALVQMHAMAQAG